MDDNPYPVDSSGIELAQVDIMDGLFDWLDAMVRGLRMASWIYRRRSGVQIGKWILGYERRDYPILVPLAWPAFYRDPCASGDCPACSDNER